MRRHGLDDEGILRALISVDTTTRDPRGERSDRTRRVPVAFANHYHDYLNGRPCSFNTTPHGLVHGGDSYDGFAWSPVQGVITAPDGDTRRSSRRTTARTWPSSRASSR
jgi:hypothetical protein